MIPWMDIWLSDRKSTRLNSSHLVISYAVFCLKKKTIAVGIRQRGTSMDRRLLSWANLGPPRFPREPDCVPALAVRWTGRQGVYCATSDRRRPVHSMRRQEAGGSKAVELRIMP